MTDLQAKKDWIKWLLTTVKFQTREVSWMLDYIYHHEPILKNIQFVERADKTPRGLVIIPNEKDGPSLTLYIQGYEFSDVDQIFHEIRFNWKKTLYVEVVMDQLWNSAYYLGVLEDNPYHRWNDDIHQEIFDEVDEFFEQQSYEQQVTELKSQIDASLDRDDRERFLVLSAQLQKLNETKN